MALSADVLKSLIVSEFTAKGFKTTGDHSKNADLAEAIAKAIVNHITTSAIVSTTVTTSAGSGTGTGKIT
jgi:hypothetical protein